MLADLACTKVSSCEINLKTMPPDDSVCKRLQAVEHALKALNVCTRTGHTLIGEIGGADHICDSDMIESIAHGRERGEALL